MATRAGKEASARLVSKLDLTKSVKVGAAAKRPGSPSRPSSPRGSGGCMIAYFDESGSHQGASVFGLACFVARERHWEDFKNRWRRLLDQQAIPEIHMADLEARRGHFEGWPQERYELVRSTIGAILSGVRSVGATTLGKLS